jgi:quercetin dioxygenase-like cupin family protein
MSAIVLPAQEGKIVSLPGGHRVRFVHQDTSAAYSLVEWFAPPAIAGPPLHIHRVTDEAFYVVEGTFGFQAGENTVDGDAGAFVFIPHGLAHTFWCEGPAPAELLILISPPGFEQYFGELGPALAAAGDSPEAALNVRQALSAKFDIEVVGPPRQSGSSSRAG